MATHREYRIRSYTHTNPGETSARFGLQLRLHGKYFSISVSESKFGNSPKRLQEFHEFLQLLMKPGDEVEEDLDAPSGNGALHRITIDDCFAWAARPFLTAFKELAPKPISASKTALAEYFNSESYECTLGALDDELVAGPIDVLATEPYFIPENLSPECRIEYEKYRVPASTAFPIFPLSEIEIVTDDPYQVLDAQPRAVRVQGKEYFFKSLEDAGSELARREIRKYEEIARANFGPAVRTSRLFAVAQDDQKDVKGILLHRIDEQDTLEFALQPDTPDDVRERWATQIQQTLKVLHEKGIDWGDAKAGNVLIDVHGDAWIVDFGGGYTRGWVDNDRAGTIAGDLEGLEKIIHFIKTGEFD